MLDIKAFQGLSIVYFFDILFFLVALFTLSLFKLTSVGRYFLFIVVNIFLSFAYVGFHLLGQLLALHLDLHNVEYEFSRPFIFVAYIRGGFVLTYALVVDFYRRGHDSERQAQQAIAKQKELEFAYNHTQVSPHLLSNGFTFINSIVEPLSSDASKAILELASIYRYSAMDIGKIRNVPLSDEVDQVESYLNFHRLLYNDEISVKCILNIDSAAERVTIPPMLLVNFVENIFKHGNFRSKETPTLITITFDGWQLQYQSTNPIKKTKIKSPEGIGMKNTIAKLENRFPGAYTLEHGVKDNFYELNLIVRYGREEI